MGHMIIHLKDADDPSIFLQRAAEVVKEGGVIAYPTDTVYGIGADPLNSNAIQRVFDIKQRDVNRGFPILVPDLEDAMKIGQFLPFEQQITEKFWPGALTIVVPMNKSGSNTVIIDESITGGSEKIAIRIPSNPIIHGICIELKKISGFGGIIGTSANFSGEPNITSGKRVAEEFSNILDFIIDTGECKEKIPSTVIKFDHTAISPEESLEILRTGKISSEQIVSALEKNL
jgi:L-threonylcarbamoyladenylate synthase